MKPVPSDLGLNLIDGIRSLRPAALCSVDMFLWTVHQTSGDWFCVLQGDGAVEQCSRASQIQGWAPPQELKKHLNQLHIKPLDII